MEALWTILYLLLVWLGVAMTPFGLPGTFLVAAAALGLGWHTGWQTIGVALIVLLFVLALLGEVMDQVLSVAGARRHGGSQWGMAGAFAGGLAGAIFGGVVIPIPVIGSLIAAFLGVFLGATIAELIVKKDFSAALQSGYGAFQGKVGATLFKTALALAMAAGATFALWSPGF